VKSRIGIGTMNIDAGGEGSGLADELIGMGYDVNRVLFGANAVSEDYYNARAEMFWNLSALMHAGMAIEPNDELEEELSVIGGIAEPEREGDERGAASGLSPAAKGRHARSAGPQPGQG
jgi:hypothetical protein